MNFHQAAAALVRQRTGLVFNDARRVSFEGALAVAMRRARVQDVNDYLSRLAAHPELLDDLVAEITVGETYFFREPRQLDVIRHEILPDLVSRRPKDHRLRIWSAGCATGEEAYTLAIMARELQLEPRPHILATDISRNSLSRAVRARYRRWSLRGVSQETIERYFSLKGDVFQIDPTVGSAVEFGYLNLATDTYPSLATGIWGMDLILCRNVLIYFDRETATRVARRLVDSLADDGWLVPGASDPIISELEGCEGVVTEGGLVYRRGAGRVRRQAVPLTLTSAPPATPPQVEPLPRHDSTPLLPIMLPEQQSATHGDIDLARSIALVRQLANGGHLEKAGRECAAALEQHRDSAQLLYLHAVLLAEAGRHAESARAARSALYLDRELIVAHLILGNALARLGDQSGARRALRNAERLLSGMSRDALVPGSDGEPAARLLEMVRVHIALLTATAA